MDARDFNTSFISTEHLKQKYFLNVVQLLSFNLMLLIFLKLTILLFLLLFLAVGVVLWSVCVSVFAAKIYIYIYLKHKILVPSLFMYSICSEHRALNRFIPDPDSTSHGAFCCAGLVFVFRVWSRIVQLVLVPHRSQRKAQKPSHIEFL